MGIEIKPQSIDEFNNLATLKISHSLGSFETPNRMVNRNDLYAKNNIGADIPLTRLSKTFILQEIIDPLKLENILNTNGFLGQIHYKLYNIQNKIDDKCLVVLYISFTEKTKVVLETDENKYLEVVKFYLDVAAYLKLEVIAIPIISNDKKISKLFSDRNLQFIPVLELKETTEQFSRKFDLFLNENSISIPIIGFKFATYLNANRGYNIVMTSLDELHEKNKATLMLDVPRYLRSDRYQNLSSPHYTPFLISDLVAEKYNIGGGSKNEKSKNKKYVRLFCKDLTVQPITSGEQSKRITNIEDESKVFALDGKLQELLNKILNGRLTETDWKYNRPSYLSRIHENIKTREEFNQFYKHLVSNSAKEYLDTKEPMKNAITEDLRQSKKAL